MNGPNQAGLTMTLPAMHINILARLVTRLIRRITHKATSQIKAQMDANSRKSPAK